MLELGTMKTCPNDTPGEVGTKTTLRSLGNSSTREGQDPCAGAVEVHFDRV